MAVSGLMASIACHAATAEVPSAPASRAVEANGVPARDDSPFQTDRLVYVARRREQGVPEAWAVVTYRNRRSSAVYIDVCGRKNAHPPPAVIATQPQYSVVQAGTGERADGIIQEWACVTPPGRRMVPAGGTLVDSVYLLPYRPPWCSLPSGDPRALFRVVYAVFVRQGGESDVAGLLTLEERRSNVFRLECASVER